VNPSAPASGKCDIFLNNQTPTHFAPPEAFLEVTNPIAPKPGHYSFRAQNVVNVGSSANEVIIHLSQLRKEVCIELRKFFGFTPPWPVPVDSGTLRFLWELDNPMADPIGDGAPELAGQMNIIRAGSTPDTCIFASVIIAR
jgi:hypothetical protein